MAITKILHMSADFQNVIDSHLNHAIDYILQPKKLGEENLSAGINCLPDGAFGQMMDTKKLFQKTGGRQGYHFILSLRPGEGTPQEMYEIAMEFAERAFYNEYEVVVAVHTDKDRIHAHLVMNSVNMVNGYKFQYHNGDWKRIYQPITNKLCEKYGLSIVPAEYSQEPTNVPRNEYEKHQTFRSIIQKDCEYLLSVAEDRKHFVWLLRQMGYEVKEGVHIAVKIPGMQRFCRLDTIDKRYAVENLEPTIQSVHGKTVRFPVVAFDPTPYRFRAKNSYQKRVYYQLHGMRVVEKYRFGYKAARYYKDIQIMHKLHAEYLFLCEHNISSFDDLWDFYDRAEKEIERIEAEQKRIYRENSSAKRKCRTEDDVRDYQILHVNNAIKLDSLKEERRKWTGDKRIAERYMNRELNESLERIAREKEYFDPEIDDTKADVPEYPYSKVKLEAECKEKERQLQMQIEEQKRQEERERRDAYYDWCRRKHQAFMQACDLPMDTKWRSEYMDYLLSVGRIAENDYTKEQLLAPIISLEEFVVERESVAVKNDATDLEKSVLKRTDLIDNEAEILSGKLGDTQENIIADNCEMFVIREESYEELIGVNENEMERQSVEQENALRYIQRMDEEKSQEGQPQKENDETAEQRVVTRDVYEKMTDKEKVEWIGISADDLTGSIKRFQQKMDELGIYFEYGGDRTDAFLKLENAVSNEALPKYRDRFRSSFSR